MSLVIKAAIVCNGSEGTVTCMNMLYRRNESFITGEFFCRQAKELVHHPVQLPG